MAGPPGIPTVTAMTTSSVRIAALAGAAGAALLVLSSLGVVAGLWTDDAGFAGNATDLLSFVLLIAGLIGFAGSGAAAGVLARIGVGLALLGLGLYTLVAVVSFADVRIGESVHPISVPLTGVGMLLTGVATLRTGHWSGWPRFAPLICGIVPFAVELPGFIAFGDSPNLSYFIACTWAAWLLLFVAQWKATAFSPAAAPLTVSGR
jgi:hypothetical protein